MRYKEFSEDVYVPPEDIDDMDYPELKKEFEIVKALARAGKATDAVNYTLDDIMDRIADIQLAQSEEPIQGPVTDLYIPFADHIDQKKLNNNLIKIANYLFDNCKPYLEQVGYDVSNNVLFRGISTADNAMLNIHQVRLDNRHPLSTPLEDHNTLNAYFTKKFGEPFRNAMFATSAVGAAEGYTSGNGNSPRAVFPIGEFTFIWSPKVKDLYTDILQGKKVSLEKILPTLGYQNTDLKEAVKSGNEVMIRCKTYCSVHMDLLQKLQSVMGNRQGQK